MLCNANYRLMRRSRNEGDRELIRQDITYALQRIQEALLREFLVVPLRDENGIWTASVFSNPQNTSVAFSCPSGSYRESNRGCSKFLTRCRLLGWILMDVYVE